MVTAVAATFGGISGGTTEQQAIYDLFNNNAANLFVGTQGTSSLPRAYLNYILFDQDFNYVDAGYDQVSSAAGTAHEKLSFTTLNITEGGYLYVYVSNESNTNFDVFFDDLRITHTKGAILQEDHYYPFGLGITALSSKAPLSKPNKYNTFQGQERTEDFKLGWIQFKWRNHDPQIGRFFNVDPLAMNYLYNSPYAFAENRVANGIDLEGLEYLNANEARVHFKNGALIVNKNNLRKVSRSRIRIAQEQLGGRVTYDSNGQPRIGVDLTVATLNYISPSGTTFGANPINVYPDGHDPSRGLHQRPLSGQEKRRQRRQWERNGGPPSINIKNAPRGAARGLLALNAAYVGFDMYLDYTAKKDQKLIGEHTDFAILAVKGLESILNSELADLIVPEEYRNKSSLSSILNVILTGENDTDNEDIYSIGMLIYYLTADQNSSEENEGDTNNNNND